MALYCTITPLCQQVLMTSNDHVEAYSALILKQSSKSPSMLSYHKYHMPLSSESYAGYRGMRTSPSPCWSPFSPSRHSSRARQRQARTLMPHLLCLKAMTRNLIMRSLLRADRARPAQCQKRCRAFIACAHDYAVTLP